MHVEQMRRQQMLMQQTSMQWTPAPQPMQHMHVEQMHRQQMLMQQMPMQWTPAPQMPMQQMPMQQMDMQEMHTQKMHMHLQRMLMQQPMPQTHAQHMPMPQEGAPDAVVQQQLCDLFDAWATADASQAELVQSVQHCALRWPLDNQRLQHVIQNQTLVCAALKVILTRREQEQTAAPDDVDEGGEARSPASTLAAEEAGNAVCAETPGASPVQAQADTATEGLNAEPNPQIEPARTAQGLLPGENTALSPPQLTKAAHTGPQAPSDAQRLEGEVTELTEQNLHCAPHARKPRNKRRVQSAQPMTGQPGSQTPSLQRAQVAAANTPPRTRKQRNDRLVKSAQPSFHGLRWDDTLHGRLMGGMDTDGRQHADGAERATEMGRDDRPIAGRAITAALMQQLQAWGSGPGSRDDDARSTASMFSRAGTSQAE